MTRPLDTAYREARRLPRGLVAPSDERELARRIRAAHPELDDDVADRLASRVLAEAEDAFDARREP